MVDHLSVEAAAAAVKACSIGIPRHSTITTRADRTCGLTRDDASARGSRGGGGGTGAGSGSGVAHLTGCVVVVVVVAVVSVLYWDVIREEEKRLLERSIYRNAVDMVALFTSTRRLFSQPGRSKSNRSDKRNARIGERRMKTSQRTGCFNQRLKG